MALALGPEKSNALPFLAVGRVKDATSLAAYSALEETSQREQTEEIFKKLLIAARQKLKPGARQRLQWNEGSVCILMDQQGELVFCVYTSLMDYPERCAFQLLQEFMQTVHTEGRTQLVSENGLTQALKPKMQELLDKYEDYEKLDKSAQTLDKMTVVKSVMQDNISKVSDTAGQLKDLRLKTDNMAESSRLFNQESRSVRQRYSCRDRIMTVRGLLVVLMVVLFAAFGFYLYFSHQDATSATPPPTTTTQMHQEEAEKTQPTRTADAEENVHRDTDEDPDPLTNS